MLLSGPDDGATVLNSSPIVKPSKGRMGYTIDKEDGEKAGRIDGSPLFFCTDEKISIGDFISDGVEKAFRYLKGAASLIHVGYQLPGRVKAYLSLFPSFHILSFLWLSGRWKQTKYD